MSKTYPKVYPLGHRGRPAGVEGGLQNKIDNSRQKSTESRKVPPRAPLLRRSTADSIVIANYDKQTKQQSN